jgi:hypothetical protein
MPSSRQLRIRKIWTLTARLDRIEEASKQFERNSWSFKMTGRRQWLKMQFMSAASLLFVSHTESGAVKERGDG